ncbi:uncharacterized protein LOC119350337 [Triticum dicoccoides]|uniref:uncharacterized protein LOC119350337 n=1 Tax=Triticum dicoccoides TaxID=85692 RepID=UPI00189054A8|nr:uncharacterized protein LOC119350337 [Triticum dicoccoides]
MADLPCAMDTGCELPASVILTKLMKKKRSQLFTSTSPSLPCRHHRSPPQSATGCRPRNSVVALAPPPTSPSFRFRRRQHTAARRRWKKQLVHAATSTGQHSVLHPSTTRLLVSALHARGPSLPSLTPTGVRGVPWRAAAAAVLAIERNFQNQCCFYLYTNWHPSWIWARVSMSVASWNQEAPAQEDHLHPPACPCTSGGLELQKIYWAGHSEIAVVTDFSGLTFKITDVPTTPRLCSSTHMPLRPFLSIVSDTDAGAVVPLIAEDSEAATVVPLRDTDVVPSRTMAGRHVNASGSVWMPTKCLMGSPN